MFKYLLTIFTLIFTSITPQLQAADNSEKVYTIGLSVWTGYPENVSGFKDSMAAEGFIEGENVTYLYGKSGNDKTKQKQIAQDFKDQADLVYSLTTPGTSIIKDVLPDDLPIVFSIVTYPADAGLIESFEYSGNNLVGTSNYVALSEYINLLTAVLPEVKRVAIFHRKGEPNSKIQTANIIRLLNKAGIEYLDLEPQTVDEMRQLAITHSDDVDVFMTTTDTLCQEGGEAAILPISLKKKIPILSSNKAGVEQGSTFGPVSDFYTLGTMSGKMAAKILKEGVDPSDLKSQLMDPPLTLINRSSVEKIGLSIPENKLNNIKYVD